MLQDKVYIRNDQPLDRKGKRPRALWRSRYQSTEHRYAREHFHRLAPRRCISILDRVTIYIYMSADNNINSLIIAVKPRVHKLTPRPGGELELLPIPRPESVISENLVIRAIDQWKTSIASVFDERGNDIGSTPNVPRVGGRSREDRIPRLPRAGQLFPRRHYSLFTKRTGSAGSLSARLQPCIEPGCPRR